MGTACGNCTCGKSETINEFVLNPGGSNGNTYDNPEKFDKPHTHDDNNKASTNNSDIDANDKNSKKSSFVNSKIHLLTRYATKIQALWKGYKTRKLIEYFKSNQVSSRYFTQEESRETLGKIYNPNAQRESRPPYKFKSGAIYKGEWKGGFRDGKGEQVWPDGAKYDGMWKDNKAHGQGIFWHIDGDTYEGNWVNGKANGFGKYVHKNGACYEGEWKDDLQHGKGKEVWADGSKYHGEYWAGKKQGHGFYEWSDGSKYEGSWVDNQISGDVFFF